MKVIHVNSRGYSSYIPTGCIVAHWVVIPQFIYPPLVSEHLVYSQLFNIIKSVENLLALHHCIYGFL